MQIKNLFLLACLLATTLLGANNTPASSTLPTPTNAGNGPCDIPPPSNFHIEEVGTTWVKYAWTNVTTFSHRVRTYRASDNLLLNTVIAPSGANIAIAIPLPSGTAVYGVINAIGIDGCNSPYEGTSEIKSTVIIDLVVVGNSVPAGGTPDCTLPQNGVCEFSIDPDVTTPFRVIKGNGQGEGNLRKFGMKSPDNDHVYHAYLNELNGGNRPRFDLKCNGTNPGLFPEKCDGPDKLEIWYVEVGANTKIGTFTASLNSNQVSKLAFTLEPGISGYSVQRLTGPFELPTDPTTPGFIRERDGNTSSTPLATASPNPFSEVLDVFLASASAENVHLQLFNLNGQQVLSQQFAGGQAQYALSTANLSPGFYMLRIEAGGVVQTLKVIKSE